MNRYINIGKIEEYSPIVRIQSVGNPYDDGSGTLREGNVFSEQLSSNIATANVVELDEDFETIMICAIRYCFGRRTYMPGLVCGYVKQYLKRISDKALHIMINDVKQALDDDKKGLFSIGDSWDKDTWIDFYDALTSECECRFC